MLLNRADDLEGGCGPRSGYFYIPRLGQLAASNLIFICFSCAGPPETQKPAKNLLASPALLKQEIVGPKLSAMRELTAYPGDGNSLTPFLDDAGRVTPGARWNSRQSTPAL